MLSKDAIKTCESLRYSGYSDSESAVYLWVSWLVSCILGVYDFKVSLLRYVFLVFNSLNQSCQKCSKFFPFIYYALRVKHTQQHHNNMDDDCGFDDIDVSRVVYDSRAIDDATRRVAEQMDLEFRGSEYENVAFLPCMTGAMFFATHLLHCVRTFTRGGGLEVGSCFATSYADDATVASDVVTEVHVKGVDVRGKKVVVIEDIVDTGGTLVALCEKLKSAGAEEVHCATLLNKKARRKKEHAEKLEKMLEKTYVGLECEDEFVVGYGLDYKGKYRCLPYIGVLKEDAINRTLKMASS